MEAVCRSDGPPSGLVWLKSDGNLSKGRIAVTYPTEGVQFYSPIDSSLVSSLVCPPGATPLIAAPVIHLQSGRVLCLQKDGYSMLSWPDPLSSNNCAPKNTSTISNTKHAASLIHLRRPDPRGSRENPGIAAVATARAIGEVVGFDDDGGVSLFQVSHGRGEDGADRAEKGDAKVVATAEGGLDGVEGLPPTRSSRLFWHHVFDTSQNSSTAFALAIHVIQPQTSSRKQTKTPPPRLYALSAFVLKQNSASLLSCTRISPPPSISSGQYPLITAACAQVERAAGAVAIGLAWQLQSCPQSASKTRKSRGKSQAGVGHIAWQLLRFPAAAPTQKLTSSLRLVMSLSRSPVLDLCSDVHEGGLEEKSVGGEARAMCFVEGRLICLLSSLLYKSKPQLRIRAYDTAFGALQWDESVEVSKTAGSLLFAAATPNKGFGNEGSPSIVVAFQRRVALLPPVPEHVIDAKGAMLASALATRSPGTLPTTQPISSSPLLIEGLLRLREKRGREEMSSAVTSGSVTLLNGVGGAKRQRIGMNGTESKESRDPNNNPTTQIKRSVMEAPRAALEVVLQTALGNKSGEGERFARVRADAGSLEPGYTEKEIRRLARADEIVQMAAGGLPPNVASELVKCCVDKTKATDRVEWGPIRALIRGGAFSIRYWPSMFKVLTNPGREKVPEGLLEEALVMISDSSENDAVMVLQKALSIIKNQALRSKPGIPNHSPDYIINVLLTTPYTKAFMRSALRSLDTPEALLFFNYLVSLMTTLSRVDTQAVQHEYKQLRAAAKAHPGTCRLPTTAQVAEWVCVLLDAKLLGLASTEEGQALAKRCKELIKYTYVQNSKYVAANAHHLRSLITKKLTLPQTPAPSYCIEKILLE